MKAIILARVSTEEQKDAGNSLPAQIVRLKNYCNNKNFRIVKSYSFDESAYKQKRDEFDKLLEQVKEISKKEKVAVCFDKVDRLSRSIFDKRVAALYEMAVADKIEIHFVSEGQIISNQMSAVEKFQFGMSLGLAKYYSDAISDNVKRAYEAKINRGEWSGKAPFGYKNIENKNGSKDIVQDETRAPFVQKIFTMYGVEGKSINQIAEELKSLGVLSNSKHKVPLHKSRVYGILRNPFYYGVMKVKDDLYPHKYEPIISKKLFDQVQDKRAQYKKAPFQHSAKPFIFRGLIKCADCGCMITPEHKKNKKYTYYSCTNSKKKHKKREYISESIILKSVKNILNNLVLSDEDIERLTEDLRKLNENKNEYQARAIKELRTEYDRIGRRISAMYDDKLDKKITEDLFETKLKEYKDKQDHINEKLSRYTDADANFYLLANHVLSLAQRAHEIFEEAEISEQRQLLQFLFQNCQLSGEKFSYNLNKPFDSIVSYNFAISNTSELANSSKQTEKQRENTSACSAWLRGWDSKENIKFI